jgi:hypothetical protein
MYSGFRSQVHIYMNHIFSFGKLSIPTKSSEFIYYFVEELDFEGSGMGSGSGDIPPDLEDSDDDDPSGQIKSTTANNHPPSRNFNPPSHPKFPNRPPPSILSPVPNHEDEEDDEDEDEDEDDNNRGTIGWNPISSNNNNNRGIIGNEDIDFDPPSPPKINRVPAPPPPFPPYQQPPVIIPAPEITTTTTTTTKKPDLEVKKTPTVTTSSGSLDDTGSKAIAFFKLFSPIIASLIGKAFSFH